MDINEILERKLAMMKLIAQAERLERALFRRVWAEAPEAGRGHYHRMKVRNRALGRLNRREEAYRRFCADLPNVTTVQVREWMLANLGDYAHGMAGVDAEEIARDACAHFDLWDADCFVPLWVHRIGEAVSVREEERRQRRMALFVEKPIRYEADGDVIWA